MNSLRHSITTLAGLACATGLLLAEPPPAPEPPHHGGPAHHHGQHFQAYLGVITADPSEALRAQLGLAEGQGILVDAVTPGSPAEKAGVQRLDVLKLFNDQILCNTEQLATLVHQAGKGASVTLTLFRKGKEEKITATLDEQPVRAPFQPFPMPMGRMNIPRPQWPNSPSVNVTVDSEKIQAQIEKAVQEAIGKVGLMPQKLQELQKEIQKNIENAQQRIKDASQNRREIQKEVENATQRVRDAVKARTQPGTSTDPEVKAEIKVQVQADDKKPEGFSLQIGGGSKAITVTPGMSLSYSNQQDQNNSSSFAQSDATGAYTLNTRNGHRVFTAKDKDGKTIFDGPVNTEEERNAVPESVRGKLQEMEKPHRRPLHPEAKPDKSPEPDAKTPDTKEPGGAL